MNDDRSAASDGWDVVVIGGGPVGLAATIELARRGIRTLLVERNDRVGHAPRAKTCNVRTCEHLRRWGIVERLRARAPFGIDYPSNIVFATRLAGHPLARFENAFFCRPGAHPLYAEHAQWIPQYKLEETLLDHAREWPSATLRFKTNVTGLEQDGDGVTLSLATPEGAQTVRSRYVIAADGAGSATRKQLGIPMIGDGALSKHRTLIFRAPELAERHAHGPAVAYWIVNRDAPSVLGPMDEGGRWYFGFTPHPGLEDAVEALRLATGLDIDPEVLSIDDWTAFRLVAERYREGRVFLAGDACHLHPPFGGYGMNLGVGDAVDIGWKLAAVLQGWAGDALLDSYGIERRPVHLRTIDEAVINHNRSSGSLVTAELEDDGPAGDAARAAAKTRILDEKIREFDTLGVVLDYRYDDSPVIVHDGTDAPPHHYRDYVPSARPGHRAPHRWLDGASTARGAALYDRFGDGFTLLATRGGDAPTAAWRERARALGIPLDVLVIDDPALHALYGARYALIRPDQHVAWRGDTVPDDVDRVLATVTGHAVQAARREHVVSTE
ncbi:FAD-dependent oxidoreductase [Pararobbsia silviterrae]|uniref:FAD-dependent oxidoreductase n=1 Tax=Pararobbsia silviterrae TaxID=1792498 RepID=A0A494X485_9BURK|nr:FAD-dependent oxidoreductase [Pararobbsia silviterrae]RKP44461.1 FAD-dependent oxidoreductase [Pararobbsia silviterrae]